MQHSQDGEQPYQPSASVGWGFLSLVGPLQTPGGIDVPAWGGAFFLWWGPSHALVVDMSVREGFLIRVGPYIY